MNPLTAGEFVLINAALMLFYSFGAIGGPFAASTAMQYFGPSALFVFSAVVYAVFTAVILSGVGPACRPASAAASPRCCAPRPLLRGWRGEIVNQTVRKGRDGGTTA